MQWSLSVVGGFLLRSALWFVPALALWWAAREWAVGPVVWLAGAVMDASFAWADGAQQDGLEALLFTRIGLGHQNGVQGTVVLSVNALKYCFGLPLLAALLLASRAQRFGLKLLLGAILLVPFQAWGVSFSWLVELSVHLGSISDAVTRFNDVHRNVFALGSQLGFLLFPSLAPVLVWAWMERSFIATVMVDGSLVGTMDKH